MNPLSRITLLAAALVCQGIDTAELVPNAKLTLEFPDLPNTLAGMVSGTEKPARLGAVLPSNYAPGSKHPLFVYLKGGSGGPDDGGAMARDIVGPEDFIAVQMPLFKKNQPKGKTLPVTMEDLPIVSAAYRTMLEKLEETLPNIDWERRALEWSAHAERAAGGSGRVPHAALSHLLAARRRLHLAPRGPAGE